MSDRLSSGLLALFSKRNITVKPLYAVTITNDSMSDVNILPYVKNFGSIKFTVFNKHIKDQGKIGFPVMTLELNNTNGDFDLGGTYFPSGLDDVYSTTVTVQVVLSGEVVLEFTGVLNEPDYESDEVLRLVLEHPLTAAGQKKWEKEDRVGGSTGLTYNFNS